MIPTAQTAARSLAGATVLQLIPAMRDTTDAHAVVDIALALLQSGARAIVASEGGPLVGNLHAIGAEWLPMPVGTTNPLRVLRNAGHLKIFIASERIDIIHAHGAAASWNALAASHRQPVFTVTSCPDRLPAHRWPATMFSRALVRGDRMVAPSSYMSRMMIDRYGIAPERITIIPHAVDPSVFSPAAVSADRVAALRRVWGIHPQMRIVLVPGRIAPWNGQMSVIDAARLIVGNNNDDVVYVFAGEDHGQPRYARSLRQQARAQSIDTLCRFVGHCADMPAAIAAADVVVVPVLEPPLWGRVAAEAQAMGRPVVATALGVLPENVLCPPRMREELRTGWLVEPGHVGEIAHAIHAALALDIDAYEALGARARQFADFMFSPHSVAEAIRGVYTSLLARDN